MAEKKVTRQEDYATWYNDLVYKADLAEHSDVRGCMVIKPYGYAIWENMQKVLEWIRSFGFVLSFLVM